MYIKGTCFENNYKKILQSILDDGVKRYVRGYNTLEISPFTYTTDKPLNNILMNKIRNINHSFRAAEWLWIMSGRNDVEMISYYNKNIKKFSDNGLVYRGAYGPVFQRQIQYILKCFKKDRYTRQAIISIWNNNPFDSKDIPCTISMQFLMTSADELDMIVNMRSNDAWLGLPYDFYNFTMIQNYLSFKLKSNIGRYTHNVGSIHLYDEFIDKAKKTATIPTYIKDIKYSEKITEDYLLKSSLNEQLMRAGKEPCKIELEPWKSIEIDIAKYFKKKMYN